MSVKIVLVGTLRPAEWADNDHLNPLFDSGDTSHSHPQCLLQFVFLTTVPYSYSHAPCRLGKKCSYTLLNTLRRDQCSVQNTRRSCRLFHSLARPGWLCLCISRVMFATSCREWDWEERKTRWLTCGTDCMRVIVADAVLGAVQYRKQWLIVVVINRQQLPQPDIHTYSSADPVLYSVYYTGCLCASCLVGQYASRPSLRAVPTSWLRHAHNISYDPRGTFSFSKSFYLCFSLLDHWLQLVSAFAVIRFWTSHLRFGWYVTPFCQLFSFHTSNLS